MGRSFVQMVEKLEVNMMNTQEMRRDLLKMALAAKSQGAHMGGSLSLVEIMAALYDGIMSFEPTAPQSETRDRLILSKGHGVMAQYAALKQLGLLSENDLETFKVPGSPLTVHPALHPELGIECATGSLGQGLAFGCGMALGLRLKKNVSSRVVVILGDGECNEGSVWESASYAAHLKLNNIIAIIDKNGLQNDGATRDILSMENMEEKWRSFGWYAVSIDGHDIKAIKKSFFENTNRPLVIIAHTVKGKGISFMENVPQWHNGILTQKLYDQALEELERNA